LKSSARQGAFISDKICDDPHPNGAMDGNSGRSQLSEGMSNKDNCGAAGAKELNILPTDCKSFLFDMGISTAVIVGSFLYSHRDMQGKMLMEYLSHLSGCHMTARWKAISTRPEEGWEILRLWHVETNEKDKQQVTRFLESMYNTNQRKLFPLGYKLRFLFDVKDSIGIHGMDKAQKLFDQQADFTKIHKSV
jgi:hypothetical protein